MNYDFAEIERRLSNMIRVGTVIAADYGRAVVRVVCDDVTTEWLPWMTRRAGGDTDWWAPDIGEQVIVIAPSGLMEAAFVIAALYSDGRPEPASSPDIHKITYSNGDIVQHDRSSGAWHIKCAGTVDVEAGGAVTVIAPSVTLDTPQTTCTGRLDVEGLLTYKAGLAGSGGSGATAAIQGSVVVTGGDVSADGIQLKGHTHTEQGDGAETSTAN